MQSNPHRFNGWVTPVTAALMLAATSPAALAEKHEHEMEQHGSHEHGVARLALATTDDGLEVILESPAANVFGFEHKANSEAEHDAVHTALEKLKDGATLFVVNDAAACKLESLTVDSSIAESHMAEKHGDDHHDDDGEKEKHGEHAHDDHKEEKDKHAEHKHDDHDDKHAEDKHDHDDGKHAEDKHDEHDHDEEKHAEHEHDEHEHDDDKHAEDKHDEHNHDAHAEKEGSHSDVEAIWAYHCDKPDAIETVAIKLFSTFPNGFEEIAVEWITAANAGKTELKEDASVSLKP